MLYAPTGDMGWTRLCEAIGANTHLVKLIYCGGHGLALVANNQAFHDGLKHNSSIRQLELGQRNCSEGMGYDILNAFHEGNSNLTNLTVWACGLDNGRISVLASMIGKCKGLKRINFPFGAITMITSNTSILFIIALEGMAVKH